MLLPDTEEHTLWMALTMRLQQPALLHVSHASEHWPEQTSSLNTSLLNREQARLFLTLISQLQQPGHYQLDVSTTPMPDLARQLERFERLSQPDSTAETEEDSVVITGRVVEICHEWQLARMAVPGGELWLPDSGYSLEDRMPIRIDARDVSLSLTAHADTSVLNILPATVTCIEESSLPGMCRVAVRLGHDSVPGKQATLASSPLLIRVSRRSVKQLWLNPGLKLWVQIKTAALAA